MADLQGETPNLLDDLFKELERWEIVLNSLANLGVDQILDELEFTASAIDQQPNVKWQL